MAETGSISIFLAFVISVYVLIASLVGGKTRSFLFFLILIISITVCNFKKEDIDTETEYPDARFPIMINGKYGYIDKSGDIVIEPKYDGISHFSNGLAVVYVDHKMGYINREGKYVWNPTEAIYNSDLCIPPI